MLIIIFSIISITLVYNSTNLYDTFFNSSRNLEFNSYEEISERSEILNYPVMGTASISNDHHIIKKLSLSYSNKFTNIHESNSNVYKSIIYYDGTFIGKSKSLEVEIKIFRDKITNIRIIDHKEQKGFYEEVFKYLPKQVIKEQSSEVDVISGASNTSNRFKEAVQDALKNAILSKNE